MYQIDPVTGEEPDGTTWATHAAIAKAVGGTVQAFDQYQGPYVVVGRDCRVGRVGKVPYGLEGYGIKRLWVQTQGDGSVTVYREDTQETSPPFPDFNESYAVEAAVELMAR